MNATATSKYIRTSPRKLRLVADAIRPMAAESALNYLRLIPKRAAQPLAKTLKQALANARQLGLSAPLKITHLSIDQGPVYKRSQPVSKGSAHSIHKYTSHIKIILEQNQPSK